MNYQPGDLIPNFKQELQDERDAYEPLKCPADLELAKKHGKAKRVYLNAQNVFADQKDVCPCCGLQYKGTSVPLTGSLYRLYHLGSGYTLYFKYIKYAIGFLVVLLLVTGIFNLVTNLMSGDCDDAQLLGTKAENYCTEGYILSFTIANKKRPWQPPKYTTWSKSRRSRCNYAILSLLEISIQKD